MFLVLELLYSYRVYDDNDNCDNDNDTNDTCVNDDDDNCEQSADAYTGLVPAPVKRVAKEHVLGTEMPKSFIINAGDDQVTRDKKKKLQKQFKYDKTNKA